MPGNINFFTNVPKEITAHIFDNVTNGYLFGHANLPLVCKQWNEIYQSKRQAKYFEQRKEYELLTQEILDLKKSITGDKSFNSFTYNTTLTISNHISKNFKLQKELTEKINSLLKLNKNNFAFYLIYKVIFTDMKLFTDYDSNPSEKSIQALPCPITTEEMPLIKTIRALEIIDHDLTKHFMGKTDHVANCLVEIDAVTSLNILFGYYHLTEAAKFLPEASKTLENLKNFIGMTAKDFAKLHSSKNQNSLKKYFNNLKTSISSKDKHSLEEEKIKKSIIESLFIYRYFGSDKSLVELAEKELMYFASQNIPKINKMIEGYVNNVSAELKDTTLIKDSAFSMILRR